MSSAAAVLAGPFRRLRRFGFGRQSALVAARRVFSTRARTPAHRAFSLLVGSLLIGTGVTLLNQANLGLSPYDVFVSGLQPRLGLSFGQTVWAVSAMFFVIAALLGCRPSRWGIAYVFANGAAIDAVAGLVNDPSTLIGRWSFVGAAIAVIGSGISLVVHSGSTGGSFELLTRAGEIRGLNRRTVRTSLEVGVLSIGIILGGRIGPATVVVALSIGPVLNIASQALEDHAVGRSIRRGNDGAASVGSETLTSASR